MTSGEDKFLESINNSTYRNLKSEKAVSSDFWCFLTVIPVKMSLRTFCVLQFTSDIFFGLLNSFLFGLASFLLSGGYYILGIVQLLLLILTLITGFAFMKATKIRGPDRRKLIQTPANAYNVSRILLWVWSAFIIGTVAIYSISMKYKGVRFAYESDRKKGINGYIFIFILYTVFCIYQILLVPVVRRFSPDLKSQVNIKEKFMNSYELGSFWNNLDTNEEKLYQLQLT